jgi:hypothetical protein
MNAKKTKTNDSVEWEQPFPTLLRDFFTVVVLMLVAIVSSAVHFFQATIVALMGLFFTAALLIKRDHLTFIQDEYDLDIYVEEKIKFKK